MPDDITMCPGGECPLRQRCYRYRAIPAGRQDWFTTPPVDAATGSCDRLWDLSALAPTEAGIRDRAYALWLAAGRPEGQSEAHWLAARDALERAAAARLRTMP